MTLDGHPGKRVELAAMCEVVEFRRWREGTELGGFFYGAGQRNIVYIVEADGLRWVFDTMYLPGVAEADLAELEALVASIRFEPPTIPAPSPSPTS